MIKLLKQSWSSPTLTGWLIKLIQPLRLLLVTPLLLTRFSEIELACWYLFASISFFGTILSKRVGITFERMVSMALGGRKDLSPIKSIKSSTSNTGENWEGIIRVYRSLVFLNVVVVIISISTSSLIGYFSLKNVLSENYVASDTILVTFILIMTSQLLLGGFQFMAFTLRGLNHVALINRWQVIFNLLSVLGGVIVLSRGGGMIQLALVMQGILILGVIRNTFLIRLVNNQKLRGQFRPRWDSEIWKWAKTPLWKGLVGQLSTQGIIQVSALILTAYATTADLSSFLFSLSLMRAAQQFAMVPFSSQLPYFTRLLAEGKATQLQKLTQKRILIAQVMLVTGVLGIGVVGPYTLELIGSNVKILPLLPWLALGLVFTHERFNTYNLAICGIGNHIAMFWQQAIAGSIAVISMFLTIPKFGYWGVIFSLAIPPYIFLGMKPPRLACQQLALKLKNWLPVTMSAHIVLVVGILGSWIFEYYKR